MLDSAAYPFPGTADFSSFLLQAQSSGAKVLGFANAGADLINCIKQAREFGLNSSMRLTALEMSNHVIKLVVDVVGVYGGKVGAISRRALLVRCFGCTRKGNGCGRR